GFLGMSSGMGRRYRTSYWRKVAPPIGLRPIAEIKVAIVHVSPARHVKPHGSIEVAHVCKTRCRVAVIRPLGEILNAELRAGAMGERGGTVRDAANGAAIGITDCNHRSGLLKFG